MGNFSQKIKMKKNETSILKLVIYLQRLSQKESTVSTETHKFFGMRKQRHD